MSRNGLHTAVYLGDTRSDQEAAAQAGIPFIHAAYGFGEADPGACRIASFSEFVSGMLARQSG